MAKCSADGSCVEFTNRFVDKNRCPKCSNYSKSFYVLGEDTYVCLECGTHFTPSGRLAELVERCSKVSFDRGN